MLTKDSFLTKDIEYVLTTSKVKNRKIPHNPPEWRKYARYDYGYDNKFHLPLMVQYPVVRGGVYYETAYYMSTHPGIVTPEVVNAGKIYVRNTIDIAREKLRQKGHLYFAESYRYCRTSDVLSNMLTISVSGRNITKIFLMIFYTLYALNEGQTYRYSVSSAGAGGMVQMIPSTYQMIRARFTPSN